MAIKSEFYHNLSKNNPQDILSILELPIKAMNDVLNCWYFWRGEAAAPLAALVVIMFTARQISHYKNSENFHFFQALDATDDSQVQPKLTKVPVSNNVLTLPPQPKLKTNNEQTKHEGNIYNNDPPKDDKCLELERRTPEGKDSDSLLESPLSEPNENSYTTDVNGKVTVHVVVTINGNGTLADLKKQRMQIRNNSGDVSNLSSPVNSIPDNDSAIGSATDVVRFTGETTQENVGYSKSKRCCVIQ